MKSQGRSRQYELQDEGLKKRELQREKCRDLQRAHLEYPAEC